MEANARFEVEEVVNHAQTCEGKITLLFKMGLTHDRTAFFSLSSSPAKTARVHKKPSFFPGAHQPILFLVRDTENSLS